MILINSITICPENITITKGNWYYGACATICPTNATCKCLTWHSSNSNVASVNQSGYICGVSEGVAVIYATAQDGSGAVGFCNVTVVAPIKASSVTVAPSTKTVNVGDTFGLSATVCPGNATDKRIRWTSCDCNIADVDYLTGCVTAKAAGTTNIYANAVDGSGVCGCCEVTVNVPNTDSTPEHSDTSSYIYHASLSEDGDEYTFTCTFSQCGDSFTVPKDQVVGSYVTSNTDPHLGDSQTPLAYGIDVSKHQGDISQSKWNEIANTQIDGNTITFAILRIGREVSNNADGSINRQKDEYFERNYERAKAAGLHVGCYYLTESWSPQNALADAEQVIEWIGDKQFEYPVFFDIESDLIRDNVSNNTIRTEICTSFMNKMREAGFFTGLYTNAEWITDYLNSSTLFPEYDFWYARYYDNTPNNWQSNWAGTGRKFGMWQYTNSKNIAPITANTVDCDVAYKNYPLIIKSLHLNNF